MFLFAEKPSEPRPPWNKGKIIGQKPPLKVGEIWSIRARLSVASRTRDLLLFNMAIDSKLRGCDLVSLRVADVTNGGKPASRASIIQQKTGNSVMFEITDGTRVALEDWLLESKLTTRDFLFPCARSKERSYVHEALLAAGQRLGGDDRL